MMIKNRLFSAKLIDKIMLGLSMSYVIFPIICFFVGWIKVPFALLGIAVFSVLGIRIIKYGFEDVVWKKREGHLLYWIITLAIIFLWIYISGIGGYGYQNWDFSIRNPMYHDLVKYSWPVIFDLSEQSEYVQQFTGTGTAALVYYFTYWIVPALVSKILEFGNFGSELVLFCWTVLGIILVVYGINRYLQKTSIWILISFIFFGGLDIVMQGILHRELPRSVDYYEWWAGFIQYSGNTTMLFYVFNQVIPAWLITIILLNMKDNRYSAGWCSLLFAYSPFATIGLVPIAICSVIKGYKWKNIKKAISITNLFPCILMLLVYGSFYLSNDGSMGRVGPAFTTLSEWKSNIIVFLLFWLGEFALILVVLGKHASREKYYKVVLAELVVLPLFHIGMANDLVMRASIPGLFIIQTFIWKFLLNVNEIQDKWFRIRKTILITFLVIGAFVPLLTMNRNIQEMHDGNHITDFFVSFGKMETEDDYLININVKQYMTFDLDEKLFFNYLAK